MHVYCEKPLGISVEEVRTVRANYLKQARESRHPARHPAPRLSQLRTPTRTDSRRRHRRVEDRARLGQPPACRAPAIRKPKVMPPSFLHYEQWIGPSPYHPYSPQYFGGSTGLNCLFWNMYRDFGVGQMGDMGAHTMDLVWNVIDAGAPTSIDIDREVSDKYRPRHLPGEAEGDFRASRQCWRGPVTLVWYQGGLKPNPPKNYIDIAHSRERSDLRGHQGHHPRRLHHPRDYPQQRRRRFDLLQAPRQRAAAAADRGTGQVTQGLPAAVARRRRGANAQAGRRPNRRPARRPKPPRTSPGMTAMPSAEVGPNGFPVVQFSKEAYPPPWASEHQRRGDPRSGKGGPPDAGGVFQREWIEACKGKSNTSCTAPAARPTATSIIPAR